MAVSVVPAGDSESRRTPASEFSGDNFSVSLRPELMYESLKICSNLHIAAFCFCV